MTTYSTHVIQICPSLGKECGIARYSLYVKEALEARGIACSVLRSCAEADNILASSKQPVVVLVQHEYGLYDSLNSKLSSVETTSSLLHWLRVNLSQGVLSAAAIIMHTIVCTDWLLSTINRQILSSGIRIFHLSSDGSIANGIEYLDHGIPIPSFSPLHSLTSSAGRQQFSGTKTVGAFGMLSPNKLPLEILRVCQRSGWNLIGCFASRSQQLKSNLAELIDDSGVHAQTYHDFADEDVILSRLAEADVVISFQAGVTHYATSGSIRFLFNLGRPVICNPCRQFVDVEPAVIYAEPSTAHIVLDRFESNPSFYVRECQRIQGYSRRHDIGEIYANLLSRLLDNSYAAPLDYRSCVESPLKSPLDLCSPLSVTSENNINSKPQASAVDIVLFSCLPPSFQLGYLSDSLQLTGDDEASLKFLLSDVCQDPIQACVLILTLATRLGAVVTWGLAEDIDRMINRPLSRVETLVSGTVATTILQYIDLDPDFQPQRSDILALTSRLQSDPSSICQLLEGKFVTTPSWAQLSELQLGSIFQKSLVTAPRIRRIFQPSHSSLVTHQTTILVSTNRRIEDSLARFHRLSKFKPPLLSPGQESTPEG